MPANLQLFQIIEADDSRRLLLDFVNAGKSKAAKIAIIAITTSSSINVKPRNADLPPLKTRQGEHSEILREIELKVALLAGLASSVPSHNNPSSINSPVERNRRLAAQRWTAHQSADIPVRCSVAMQGEKNPVLASLGWFAADRNVQSDTHVRAPPAGYLALAALFTPSAF